MRAPEGYEISVATNHFGHFLLSRLLPPSLVPVHGPARAARLWELSAALVGLETEANQVTI